MHSQRSGANLLLSEAVATSGLLVDLCPGPQRTLLGDPWAVCAYIAPASVPGFVAAQLVGLLLGLALVLVVFPDAERSADDVIVPHHGTTATFGSERHSES